MAKTYTAVPTVTAGDVYTASAYNTYTSTNVSNLIVPPAARIRLTSSVLLANATHTTVGFTSSNATEDFDTDGMITLSGSSSSITIQTAGIYSCAASFDFASNATGIRYGRIFRDRSGTQTAIAAFSYQTNPSGVFHTSAAGIIECAVGDVIYMAVYQSSGGNLNLEQSDAGTSIQYGGTWMSAVWIGRTS